ncbi:hypothetical protein EVJ58_g7579 [Rhodofomes roseus]|uniref:Integrase catalytic domain-containing protein n=1 Tax=Rhodofomes roseus TaxID=34475 RepID=A0A4Y9Y540_9APHY|nr:hypothetical protein EVJ58_g7579 [Rhodofomes roseus]
MTEEVLAQIGYLKNAASIWAEARRLYAGQSSTDWTMTITNLVTTRYAVGQDLLAHIAKMKGFCRDLILMNRDIDDELYACFLRISMPTSWNYVFAGLPDRYSSQEVERQLKDEHGIHANQQTQSHLYRAGNGKQSFGKKKRKGRGGNGSQNGESTPHAGSSPGKANSGSDSATQTSTAQTSENKQNRGASSGKQPHRPYRPYTQQQQRPPRANQAVDDAASVSDAGHDSSYLAAGPIPHSRFTWILDGGSTTHICNDRSAFRSLCETRGTIGSIQKTGPQLQVLGRGEIRILCRVDGRDERTVTLKDVAYCPDARDNLISESRMDHHGLEIRKRNGTVAILKPNGDVAMQGTLRYNLYELDCAIAPPDSHPSDVAFSAKSDTSNIDLWHRRLGHLNERSIRHLAKQRMVTGLDLVVSGSLGPCGGCAYGKHARAPFPEHVERAKEVLERLHMDLQGPFLPSILGYTYTLAVVDDASRKGWKEYLKHKSDATDEIKALVTRLETLTGKKLKYLRTDGGGEFINRILGEWLREKGITHEYSTPDTPQQNGVTERFNRTTHEHALCMLHEAGMKPGFWPEAHEYASYVRNMSPTSALDGMTPDEAFSGTKPNVSTLRIFGSPCHVRILPKDRSKLDALSTASIGGVSPGTDTRSDVDPLIKSTSSLPATSSTPAAQTEPRSSPTTSTTSPSPSAMSSPDPPLRRSTHNGVFSIIAVHVDNMLSFSENPDELARIRHHLHDLFEMKEEDANWLMGFEIIDYLDSHTVAISHRQYVETVIKRFRMDGCTPVSTPMEKGLILDKYEGPFTPEEEEQMRRTPYRALIGALTWISLISRPDIAFATTYLAQFNSNSGPEHWEAAQHILVYLAGTLNHVLLLGGEGEDATRLIGWSDADHGRDIVDRQSVSAYVWQIGNTSVSWSSKKQQTVAISSTESEYMAMTHSSKHGIWLRRLLIELNELVSESEIATPIFVDNKSSIDLSKEARFHARTKHIDVQHHFIREHVEDGMFVVMHVPSHLNIADGLTKPLDRVSFEIFVDALGLVS